MADVSIAEAKAKLSEIVARVEAGEPQVITRRGKPVARIVAVERSSETRRPSIDVDALRAHIDKLMEIGSPEIDGEAFMRRWKEEQRG